MSARIRALSPVPTGGTPPSQAKVHRLHIFDEFAGDTGKDSLRAKRCAYQCALGTQPGSGRPVRHPDGSSARCHELNSPTFPKASLQPIDRARAAIIAEFGGEITALDPVGAQVSCVDPASGDAPPPDVVEVLEREYGLPAGPARPLLAGASRTKLA